MDELEPRRHAGDRRTDGADQRAPAELQGRLFLFGRGPRIAVRAGVAYEESPITDEVRTPRLPDNDRIWLSLGATYKWSDKLSFDAAFTHIFVKDTPIRIVPGHAEHVRAPFPGLGVVPLNFVADVDANVNIFSVALKYRWDDPKVPIPAAPIVRKY
jgi:long-chain fatty acid transport protein